MAGAASNAYVTLSSGAKMPLVGLGTWKSKPGQVEHAVQHALETGYRHIDCAAVYQNETEVGVALKEQFAKGLKREEVWITSKVWNNNHTAERVKIGLAKTLKDLGLTYLDLYLIHWPYAFVQGDNMFPKDEGGMILYDESVDYVETWKGMEQLVRDGLVKHIGFSNFNHKQVQRVLEIAQIKPEILQVECHVYLNQQELLDYIKPHGIVLTAYCPLGSPDRPTAQPDHPILLQDPTLAAIAAKYKKTPAQVLIRFQIDRGVSVIPKSVSNHRIEENFNVFDFRIDADDLKTLLSLNRNYRFNPQLRDVRTKHFPFNEPF
jgi:diketogulonate reductase-like aldo/keto reductase